MLRLFTFFILSLCLLACHKPVTINLAISGKWQLEEMYMNSGVGGEWKHTYFLVPVEIEFGSDGKFKANNSLYFQDYNHYQILSNDSLKLSNTYLGKTNVFNYKLDQKLTFYYNCIEGCADKFGRK